MKFFKSNLYRLIAFFLLLFFMPTNCFSQHITAYTDYINKFYVVDHTRVQKLEHLSVKSFQVADDCLAYVDNVNTFKAYYHGKKTQIEAVVEKYRAYKGLVLYETAGVIKVFSRGQKLLLSGKVVSYKGADNIAAFVDVYDRAFKVFTDTTHVLERHNSTAVVSSYAVAPGTLAYVDSQQNFYLYLNGEKNLVAEYFEGNYEVGQNIVAYTDTYDYTFKTYFNNESFELEPQYPLNYKTGKNLVAWVSIDGGFKVFYNGEIIELSSYSPAFYTIKDDLLVYNQNGYFYLFYKGKSIEIEPFVPNIYYIDNQTLVYKDQSGYIKAYIQGEYTEITRQPNNSLTLNGNAIFYFVNQNEPRVWYKGEEIEF